MADRQDRLEHLDSRLSAEACDAIADYAARAAWPSGFQVYERGTPADGVFVVLRGRVVLRSRVRAGRAFVPWVATAGETFGAEGLAPNAVYSTEARADAETETLFVSTSKLRAFVREQPAHALTLIGQMMAERTTLLDKLRELTTLTVEQRLVAALHRMARHDGFLHADGRIELCPARYRLLCELVGATRESVSLVLGRFAAEGHAERVGSTMFVSTNGGLFERAGHANEDVLLVQAMSANGADSQASLQ